MKKLILTITLLISFALPCQAYTGKDKMCHDIGYLSTSCQTAEIVPFELVDKKVALEKAKSGAKTSYRTQKTITINQINPKPNNDVILKSWLDNE